VIVVSGAFDTRVETQVGEDFEADQHLLAYQIGNHHRFCRVEEQGQGQVSADTGHDHEQGRQQRNPYDSTRQGLDG
jgi:hypothetical protein